MQAATGLQRFVDRGQAGALLGERHLMKYQ